MAAQKKKKKNVKQRAKRAAMARAKRAAKVPPAKSAAGGGPRLTFNHAMVYVTDVERALGFYRDALGFRVIDSYPGAYARLRSPGSRTTIAVHCLERGQLLDARLQGMRLYFEVGDLGAFCRELAQKGVVFTQQPKRMPWGWSHAYLKDPDGHEISLYRAGAARLRRTRMAGGTA